MSNVQIPNLTAATALNGSEEIEAVQAGSSVRVTAQQIANLTTNVGTVTQVDTSGPITGGPITTTGTIALASQGVTNAYLALMPAYTLKGNATGASAVAQDLTATQALGLLGIGGIANNTLLGNISGSSANPTAISLSSYIDSAISNTQGAILYRGASGWSALPPSTTGSVLTTNGGAANPSWNPVAGTGTVTSVATGTGLTGGPITTSGTISIANTAVAAGAYGSQSSVGTFTVNAQGQLTAAASVPINAVALTTGTISTAPTNDIDIANKLYVDSVAQGLNFHAACNYATTTSNVYTVTYNNGTSGVGATLTNAGALAAFSIDGVTMTSGNIGNRLLIKNQANAAYNGVYTLTTVGSGSVAWVLTRATDYDSSGAGTNEIDAGDFMLVLSGSTQANTSWVQQTLLPIIVGTTGITFTQFGAPVVYSAGTGLTLAGTAFSITNTAVTANSYGSASAVGTFTVNAQGQLTAASSTNIAIAASQVTSGTLAVAQGGSGAATLTGYLKGNGTSAFTASATIPSSDISGLGTMAVQNANSVAITGGTINGTTIGASTPSTGSFTSLTDSGNLTFTGTGNRITGDFSNATVANRVMFQTSTANSNTVVEAIPSGTSQSASLVVSSSSTDPANTSTLIMNVNGASAVSSIQAAIRGTGTYLPMTFYTGGSERMRIDTSGNVGVGTSSPAVKFAISSTDAILIPVGTTAQQPTGASGMLRFNTSTTSFEGYNGTAWGSIGGGATGGGTDQIFYLNGQTVTTNYSIPSGQNAGTFGPVTVNSGATVTIPTGSTWSIV